MVRRLGSGRSALTAPARLLVERSVRSRAFPFARWPILRVEGTDPDADSIEHHLAQSLDTEVRVGILLGTRRANQKPVLQVFGLDGTTLGYAKVGHNELTTALIRREADALIEVGGHLPHSFRPPRLLHHGRWRGLEVVVVSALPTVPGQPVTPTARLAAERELAELAGTTRATLADSGFWTRLCDAAAQLPDTPGGDRLREAMHRVEERHGADDVRLGCWHGDWGFWNMGMAHGVLQVWDWERFDPEVPVGFDSLHFAIQSVRPGERDAGRREATFLRVVAERLAELGVRPAQHDLTLHLYLIEIAARYVDALSHGATPALRRRTSWVLSLLEQLTEHPQPALSEGRP